jgi:CRISPR-associated protein Csh2
MKAELKHANKQDLKTIEDLAYDYIDTKNKKINRLNLLNDHIDIKLFGLLFAVGEYHFHQIGPVQFSIGQSLNDNVEEMPIRMTRVVPTREEAKGGGFGEKYIVRYSFIGFHGFVNDVVAKDTNLSEEDIKIMLKAMWRGTTTLSTSSKFGQQSRLLLKINYKDQGYIGDLDLKPNLERKADPLENISQLVLNLTDLFNTFSNNRDIIESIEYESSSELICSYNGEEKSLDKIIELSKIKGLKLTL